MHCRYFCKQPSVLKNQFKLCGTNRKNHLILGIETSCDDTGCAILDINGNILGEALNSQHSTHLKNGGIIPPLAQELHRKNIENVVSLAIDNAKVSFNDISAVAVTVKPGLPLSLVIGTKYAKYLCKIHKKPLIPIHHMKAHALTARMFDKNIAFPFMVLLVSGGHCLLTIANSIENFVILGNTLDNSPGETFDKISRRMKLHNIPEYSSLSGGQAIELAASKAEDPLHYKFTLPLQHYRNCNFSMAGLKNAAKRHIFYEEQHYDLPPDGIIPGVHDLCAGLLLIITRHLCYRVQRGMQFATLKGLIPSENKALVVSGGVACNNYIAKGLHMICDEMGYKLVRPPPKLCTDNGIMIAWNGVERWKANLGVYENFDHIDIEKQCPIGPSIIDEVTEANLSCKWVKLTKLYKNQDS